MTNRLIKKIELSKIEMSKKIEPSKRGELSKKIEMSKTASNT
ncbi:hypothetical protein [Mycobacterium sp. 94-17]|nr:hypothetical protein [Mycobacterium sp. 94-17]MEB4210793.1 hypothetical protein [Mycobacterium sp. 94-17]